MFKNITNKILFFVLNSLYSMESTIISPMIQSEYTMIPDNIFYNNFLLIMEEAEQQKKYFQQDIKVLEEELSDQELIKHDFFDMTLLTNHIRKHKILGLFEYIKIADKTLYTIFFQLITHLSDEGWKINDKYIFNNCETFKDLNEEYPVLKDFDKSFLNTDRIKCNFLLNINYLMDYFSNIKNFTEDFLNYEYNQIKTKNFLSFLVFIKLKLDELSDFNIKYLQLNVMNFLKNKNDNMIINLKQKKEEDIKKIFDINRFFPLEICDFSIPIGMFQRKSFINIYGKLEKFNGNSFVFMLENTLRKNNLEDEEHVIGDCSFRAEQTTRLQLLYNLIKDNDLEKISHIILYYIMQIEKNQIEDYGNLNEIISKIKSNFLNQIEDYGNLNEIMSKIMSNFLKKTMTNSDNIIKDIIGGDSFQSYPIISFERAINYLKKYHSMTLNKEDEKILLNIQETSIKSSTKTIDLLKIIEYNEKGQIQFKEKFKQSNELTINITIMIKIILASFILNGSYYPSIIFSAENSICAGNKYELFNRFNLRQGIKKKLYHSHSWYTLPIAIIQIQDLPGLYKEKAIEAISEYENNKNN